MSYLVVCPLSQLEDTAAQHQPRDIISLMNIGTAMVCPSMVTAEHHHFLGFNDITEPQEGLVTPSNEHIREILSIANQWRRDHPLLIHCFMGISRSTASAYIVACALSPATSESEIANLLRQNAPSATPNKLMVSLADDLLGRNGRMRQAIAGIGRGAEAFEGTPFMLPINN
ncbi:tyrosine phosphatase family protein [Bartonella sp. LJL80]